MLLIGALLAIQHSQIAKALEQEDVEVVYASDLSRDCLERLDDCPDISPYGMFRRGLDDSAIGDEYTFDKKVKALLRANHPTIRADEGHRACVRHRGYKAVVWSVRMSDGTTNPLVPSGTIK